MALYGLFSRKICEIKPKALENFQLGVLEDDFTNDGRARVISPILQGVEDLVSFPRRSAARGYLRCVGSRRWDYKHCYTGFVLGFMGR